MKGEAGRFDCEGAFRFTSRPQVLNPEPLALNFLTLNFLTLNFLTLNLLTPLPRVLEHLQPG